MGENLKPKQKIRRGGRGKKKKDSEDNFIIYGTNAAGLSSKLNSLKDVLKVIKPKVFIIQETKHNNLKIDNYEIFEKKRDDNGGGLAIGFHNSLK